MEVRKTEDWHEDIGCCIFFHFESFEEPPEVICSNPLCSDFEDYPDGYWTHFIVPDFNSIFEQAMEQS